MSPSRPESIETPFALPALGGWSREAVERFCRAEAELSGLMADCTVHMEAARVADDATEFERLKAERTSYALRRRKLAPEETEGAEI